MRKFLATRKPSAKVRPQEIGSSVHEITLVCFQSRALPAAWECARRAVADPFAIAVKQPDTSTVALALANALANAITHTVAGALANAFPNALANTITHTITDTHTITETVADPEAFPNTQTYSSAEA